ncbi:hypothetical protein HKD37_09G025763 [Glycine soja]
MYEQANYCADALANLACGLEEDYVIFDHPKLLLLADVSGVSTPRLISIDMATWAGFAMGYLGVVTFVEEKE